MPAGTIELLVKGLANALAPLERRLSAEEVDGYFAQLGMQFPSSVTADPAMNSALQAARTAAGGLAPLAAGLAQAIETDNLAAILAQGAAALGQLGEVFNKLDLVGTALNGMANAFPGVPPAQVSAFAAGLPRAILDLAIIERVEQVAPEIANLLAVVGIIDRHIELGDPGNPAATAIETRRLRLDRLGDLLSAPTTYFQNLYGWGGPGFDGQFLFEQLEGLAAHAGMPSLLIPPAAPGDPLSLDLFFFELQVKPPGLHFELRFPLAQNYHKTFKGPRPGWQFQVDADGQFDAGLVGEMVPPSSLSMTTPAGPLNGGIRLQAVVTPAAPGGSILILGQAGGTRLEAASLALELSLPVTWDGGANLARSEPKVELAIHGGRFALNAGPGGDLLAALLPKDGLGAQLELGLGLEQGKIYLRGSAGLQATFPVHLSLGPVEVHSITVGLAPGAGGGLPVEISSSLSASLGPLTMLVDRVGLIATFRFPAGGHGSLGPLDLSLGFKFPTGIGIVVEAGPVSGGGFLALDPAAGRYSGVLQLKLTFIDIVAFAIYETIPASAPGPVSFVAVMGVRFPAGIQLGFGFMLTGVGGMIGMNRRANADVLRERLASGAAGNTLFCEDPVRNAPSLLGDLAAFFPASAGGFLVGPTLQIGWMFIVRLDLGLIIEFPGPSRILIIGSARAMIGVSEDLALLFLRMDIFGEINFAESLLAFDAALVNSRALGILKLTGGMAFRLHWGSNPYVVLSIGGFHPRFDPGPLRLPAPARVGGSLDISVVVEIWVRLEMYLAFTSNTLQAGARVEAGMELGPMSARGFFAFDALLQFRPFYFEADFSAGFHVDVFDFSLASVEVSGSISGPGPVVIRGEASVRKLFLKVSASVTFRLGEDNADKPTPVPSLVRALEPELSIVANLRVEGEDRQVFLKPERAPAAGILLTPKGSLIWEQKRLPLETTIHRLEGVDLGGAHLLRLDPFPGWATSTATDWFSPGAFTDLDLKASQTLNNTTFQELPSGIKIGSALDVSAPSSLPAAIKISLYKRPQAVRFGGLLVAAYLNKALKMTLHERSSTPPVDPGPAKVQVRPETYNVVTPKGSPVLSGQTPFQAFQKARENAGHLALPEADVPVNL